MADYLRIQTHSKQGTLGISRKVFEFLATDATNRVQGVTVSKAKKIKSFTLSNPVKVSFRKDGKVEIEISVNLKKGTNASQICSTIQEQVANVLSAYTESVPFDIDVKIADIK